MSIDEKSIQLQADAFYRSIPDDAKSLIHRDDILYVIRSSHIKAIKNGKSARTKTAIIGVCSLIFGFIVGASSSTSAAWILGIIAGTAGFVISEKIFSKSVGEAARADTEKALAELLFSRAKS